MRTLLLFSLSFVSVSALAKSGEFSKPKTLVSLSCSTPAGSDRPLLMDVLLIDDGSIITEWTIKDSAGKQLDKSMDFAGDLEIRGGKYLGWTGSEQSSDIDIRTDAAGDYNAILTFWKEVVGTDEPPVPYEMSCRRN